MIRIHHQIIELPKLQKQLIRTTVSIESEAFQAPNVSTHEVENANVSRIFHELRTATTTSRPANAGQGVRTAQVDTGRNVRST